MWCSVNSYLHITWLFSVCMSCYVIFSFRVKVVKLLCNDTGYFSVFLCVVLFVISSNFCSIYLRVRCVMSCVEVTLLATR
jgi:hypothetical protein